VYVSEREFWSESRSGDATASRHQDEQSQLKISTKRVFSEPSVCLKAEGRFFQDQEEFDRQSMNSIQHLYRFFKSWVIVV
jgi:hypothetical protein